MVVTDSVTSCWPSLTRVWLMMACTPGALAVMAKVSFGLVVWLILPVQVTAVVPARRVPISEFLAALPGAFLPVPSGESGDDKH